MADGRYVIFGASGHVGGVVATRLLEAGKQVRVVARKAEGLSGHARRGAEVATGSIDDAPFVRRAVEGAGAVFVVVPTPVAASGIRAWQDRVAGIVGDALEAARVPRAVTLSSIGADLPGGTGPIAGLHALEERLNRIAGLEVLHLRPGYFLENHLGAIGLIRGMGANGGAIRADLKMVQIATRDIGEVAARRLLALDWNRGEVQELQGERELTMVEVTAALGKAIGKPELRYVQFPYPDAEKGMVQAGLPAEAAGLFVEMARAFNEGRARATQPRSAATTTPTSVERFATEVFAPAWRAAG